MNPGDGADTDEDQVAAPTRRPVSPPAGRSPWVAVAVILVGSYAATLNLTVVGVALPSIAADMAGRGDIDVDWVITSFLMGVVLVLPLTGWLADRYGRKSVFIASLVVFALGALVCAAAPGMELLVAARLVQGLGGGALMPTGMAMVYDLFPPHRRGMALGIWGVAIMGAPATGPPLGGWIVTAASWRWIFGTFTVIALVAAALAHRWLGDVGHRETRRLDLTGWAIAAAGVAMIVVGLRQVPDWGPTSATTLTVAVASVVTVVTLVVRSLRRADPIIEFRMFTVPTFAVAMAVVWLLSIAQFAQLNFLPVALQVVRGFDAQQVGLLLVPPAIGVALTMPVGGWLLDRIGARVPVSVGLALTATSMWRLAHLDVDTTQSRIVQILVIQGIGMGLVLIPTTVCAMNSLPGRLVAQASAVNNLNRQLGGAIGVAVLSAVLVTDLGAVAPTDPDLAQAQAAYNRVFLVAFWFVIAAALAGIFLPGLARTRRDHQARAAEMGG